MIIPVPPFAKGGKHSWKSPNQFYGSHDVCHILNSYRAEQCVKPPQNLSETDMTQSADMTV